MFFTHFNVRQSGGSYSTSLVTANHNNVNQTTSRTDCGGRGSTVAVEGTVSKPATITISQPAQGQTTLPASSVRAQGSAYAFSGTSAVTTGANQITVSALDGNNSSASAMVQVVVTNPGPGATTYDLSGNLTSDGVRSYTWDAANRLVKITYAGTGNSTAFAYDGMSRRVREVESEGGVVVKTRRFVWEGLAIAEERLGDNSMRRAFYSQGVRCLEPGGVVVNQLYGRDHLGSVRQLTTTAGAALARYDYDLWGRRSTRTAAAVNAEPKSGALFHDSANGTPGNYHQHYFVGATQPLPLATGDKLTSWVYLDPANPPTEVMLQFADSSWEHRAYWGANQLPWGTDNSNARRYMGPLPATGGWVKLEVPITSVGLTGPNISGMAFTLVGGKANWDRTGKVSSTGVETVWFEDKLPAGAITAAEGGDSWSWTEGQAAPQGFTGHFLHARSGLHLAPYRAYSAELGRWLNRDPIVGAELLPEGPNIYNYVGGSPVGYVDQDGLTTIIWDMKEECCKARGGITVPNWKAMGHASSEACAEHSNDWANTNAGQAFLEGVELYVGWLCGGRAGAIFGAASGIGLDDLLNMTARENCEKKVCKIDDGSTRMNFGGLAPKSCRR